MTHRFVSLLNFLDPELTPDGKPYRPQRYNEIMQERYIITKRCNISYIDTGIMSPSERRTLLHFITEDSKKEMKAIEEAKINKNKH